MSDYYNLMELRFPEWERVINEGKLLEVRKRVLQKLDILDREMNTCYTSDKQDEVMRLKKAFLVLLRFQDELLKIKDEMKK